MCFLLAFGVTAAVVPPPRTVYYLHGKIVEDLGPRGISDRFGAYDYPGIVAALSGPGRAIISEIRPRDTDPADYADRLVAEIRARIAKGEDPARITFVGASKGAVIAALVSARLKVPRIRYVLLAACNDSLIRTFDPHLTGDVLSVYEASDDIAGSCSKTVARSPAIGRFREIRLATGLGHGIVYRPLPAWLKPAQAWIDR